MLEVSFWELGIIFIVALLVLGPDRLPTFARFVGRCLGRARKTWENLKNELDVPTDRKTDR